MGTGSIIKMINTTANSKEENHEICQKHLEYILRSDATDSNLTWCNMVDPDNILGTFGFFARCADKDKGRPLKHIVISYSTRDTKQLPWNEYLSVTKEIASFFGDDYQMVAAVHNNIEHRPHAHIVMDCLDVSTEKKYSEPPRALEKFKDYIDKVLAKYKIPLLQRKRCSNSDALVVRRSYKNDCLDDRCYAHHDSDDYSYEMPTVYLPYQAVDYDTETVKKEVESFLSAPNELSKIRHEIYSFFFDKKSNGSSELPFKLNNIFMNRSENK